MSDEAKKGEGDGQLSLDLTDVGQCNRTLPCTLCDKSELKCTYANKLKKRGPKGKIVERIKRLQAQEDHGEEKEEESVLSISKRMVSL